MERLELAQLVEISDALVLSGDILSSERAEYQIRQCLGRGAVGTVWEAQKRDSDREVAIKILSPASRLVAKGRLKDIAHRFRREASLGEEIRHPNVVRYLDHGTYLGLPFCCLELCPRTVAGEIAAAGGLSIERSTEILEPVIDGLQHLHDKGLIHRDIKPSNLLIRSDNTICLGDLGIVRVEDAPDETAAMTALATRYGSTLGSWYYMAPEQRRAAGLVGPPADVYSLGVSWHEMLSGAPVPAPERIAVHDYRPAIHRPHVFNVVISRMLSYSPAKRPGLSRIRSCFRFLRHDYELEVERIVKTGLVESRAEDVDAQTVAVTSRLLPRLDFADQAVQRYLIQAGHSLPPPLLEQGGDGSELTGIGLDQYLHEMTDWTVARLVDSELYNAP